MRHDSNIATKASASTGSVAPWSSREWRRHSRRIPVPSVWRVTYIAELPQRLLTARRLLNEGLGGYQISRYQHRATATRHARRRRHEMLVASAAARNRREPRGRNHSAVRGASSARTVCRGDLGRQHAWLPDEVTTHITRHRPRLRGCDRDPPWFDSCYNFCAEWDQESFDTNYRPSRSRTFEPIG